MSYTHKFNSFAKYQADWNKPSKVSAVSFAIARLLIYFDQMIPPYRTHVRIISADNASRFATHLAAAEGLARKGCKRICVQTA